MLRVRPSANQSSSHRHALDAESERQLVRIWWTTPCSLRQLAREFRVSHMTVYRLVQTAARPQ
ncbi:MAG: hypothetical protein M1530_03840 [Candidatus Marsarchaeota archaeon]|nr:hypothetical protein [Candidatus Marsarchaeota archaeon]